MTEALAEALAQKKRLYARLKEVRTLVETTADPGERLLSGGGTVGDCVDAETYRRMMELSMGTGRGFS